MAESVLAGRLPLEGLEQVREELLANPEDRLRWRVLTQFGVLPSERRARTMTGQDYLWCLVNMLLDREEALERLCPDCRAGALEERCPRCGRPVGRRGEEGRNASFDPDRFEALRGGGGV